MGLSTKVWGSAWEGVGLHTGRGGLSIGRGGAQHKGVGLSIGAQHERGLSMGRGGAQHGRGGAQHGKGWDYVQESCTAILQDLHENDHYLPRFCKILQESWMVILHMEILQGYSARVVPLMQDLAESCKKNIFLAKIV